MQNVLTKMQQKLIKHLIALENFSNGSVKKLHCKIDNFYNDLQLLLIEDHLHEYGCMQDYA